MSFLLSVYDTAAGTIRGELLAPDLPRHFRDLLQDMLAYCEACLPQPQEHRAQYVKFLAYKQRQDRYGH